MLLIIISTYYDIRIQNNNNDITRCLILCRDICEYWVYQDLFANGFLHGFIKIYKYKQMIVPLAPGVLAMLIYMGMLSWKRILFEYFCVPCSFCFWTVPESKNCFGGYYPGKYHAIHNNIFVLI